MYHANKWVIFTSFNYCYKTDRSQYNDSIMAFFFFQNSVGWQFELGKFTSAPKGGGWNQVATATWQASWGWLLPAVLLIGLLVDWGGRTNWTGVSEPSRLTWASSGGGQVLQSTGHVSTKHIMYEIQISVCYWPNLATWPKIKLTLRGLLQDTRFAKAWSAQFAINPLQSLLAQPCVRHVSYCSDQTISGEGLFWFTVWGSSQS